MPPAACLPTPTTFPTTCPVPALTLPCVTAHAWQGELCTVLTLSLSLPITLIPVTLTLTPTLPLPFPLPLTLTLTLTLTVSLTLTLTRRSFAPCS